MFIHSRDLADDTVIEADLCIMGSGPAGLAIAREYLDDGARVVMLEAGDTSITRRSQAAYRAEVSGAPNHAATHSRFRVYGGSATRWTGQCVPLDAIDFERREEIPDSGWPFGLDELLPCYQRAQALFGVVSTESLTNEPDQDLARGVASLSNGIIRFARPVDVGEQLSDVFSKSQNVDVVLDASVVDITTDEHARHVTQVAFTAASGRRFTCRARRFVLACGGIENARLLLASNSRAARGLGNDHDVVGRYFMDHPYLTSAYWKPSDAAVTSGLHVIDDFSHVAQGRGAHSVLTLQSELRRHEGLAACVGYFIHRQPWQLATSYFAPGGRAIVHAAEIVRGERVMDRDIKTSLRAIVRDPRSASRTLRGALAARKHPVSLLALRLVLEATPRADSRITLGRSNDAFGMPRARVDWRINERDWLGAERLREELACAIRSKGLGTLIDDASTDADGWPISMTGGKHHMGATRMHDDPAHGVVDANARVHSLENLYVAGSSVFPTGGWANPTLTIVALAIRLADHLRETA